MYTLSEFSLNYSNFCTYSSVSRTIFRVFCIRISLPFVVFNLQKIDSIYSTFFNDISVSTSMQFRFVFSLIRVSSGNSVRLKQFYVIIFLLEKVSVPNDSSFARLDWNKHKKLNIIQRLHLVLLCVLMRNSITLSGCQKILRWMDFY